MRKITAIGNSSRIEAEAVDEAEDMAALRLDDPGEVERARPEHHRDQHEADRDFVRDHLSRGAQRAVKRIFRVGRPAGDDDP